MKIRPILKEKEKGRSIFHSDQAERDQTRSNSTYGGL